MNPSDFLIYFVHLQMTQDFSPPQRLRGHKLLRRASSGPISLSPLRNRAAAILSLRLLSRSEQRHDSNFSMTQDFSFTVRKQDFEERSVLWRT